MTDLPGAFGWWRRKTYVTAVGNVNTRLAYPFGVLGVVIDPPPPPPYTLISFLPDNPVLAC